MDDTEVKELAKQIYVTLVSSMTTNEKAASGFLKENKQDPLNAAAQASYTAATKFREWYTENVSKYSNQH